MSDQQVQKAANGSVAIQAQRDAVYNQGISPGQMIEIMDAVSRQVQTFSATAKDLIDARLDEFKSTVLEKIATQAPEGAKSFADPDFQHSLLQAQTAYARTDAADLHFVLTDLIIQRSKQEKRDRLTLTLNDAIAKAASLTLEDFSALALIFVIQQVNFPKMDTLQGLAGMLSTLLVPLANNMPTDETAMMYLESHGCIKIESGIVQRPAIANLLKQNYPGLVTKGVPDETLRAMVSVNHPLVKFEGLIHDSAFNNGLKVLVPGAKETLERIQSQFGITPTFTDRYFEEALKNAPDDAELTNKLNEYEPALVEVFNKYDQTSIRRAFLTPVGIALGHAHLMKTSGLSADLSIWIT